MSEKATTKTAVISAGGRQYVVQEGSRVRIDRIPNKKDEPVTFDEVLLVSTGKTTKVGTPVVEGARVEGVVADQARHDKVVGVKMKSKKRNKTYFGHKQPYTAVKITKIATK